MWKVAFHIDELEKWLLVFGNLGNFLGDCGSAEVQAVVVANAGAVLGAVREDWQAEFQQLAAQGVLFECCRIALRGNGIDPARLPEAVKTTPSGIRRLIELQQAGFAYIKP